MKVAVSRYKCDVVLMAVVPRITRSLCFVGCRFKVTPSVGESSRAEQSHCLPQLEVAHISRNYDKVTDSLTAHVLQAPTVHCT